MCCLTKLPSPICDEVLLLAAFPPALSPSWSPKTAVPWGVPAQGVPVPAPGCLCLPASLWPGVSAQIHSTKTIIACGQTSLGWRGSQAV